MEHGRGETVRLVNSTVGTEKVDVHLNRLVPGGPRGRLHRHSQSDNIYIVRHGEGVLTVDGESHILRADQIAFIPAGVAHSLSNLYPVHVMTRKFFGLMTRKLSVTESQRSVQFRGTVSRRKPSVASANWAQVA
jgi:glyoxylate utilization-related uncharacterized protein